MRAGEARAQKPTRYRPAAGLVPANSKSLSNYEQIYENIVEYRRTAVIKLDTPKDADEHLRETIEQFKYCANTASEWCWHGDDGYHVTSKAKAEDALYDQFREDTDLTANLVQKGIHQAVESIKSGVERLKNDQDTSRPTFTADTAVYDKRSATFHRDHVSLSTPDGRIECDYILPDVHKSDSSCAAHQKSSISEDDADTPPTKYVTDEDYEFRRATLHRRDGDWYLHASMLKEDDTDTTTGHRTVLGVDLGVNQLAVASTGRFWSADEFNHWKREYEKRRGDLQQCGTRAAHEAIAGVERKEDGRFEMFLHRVANEIVAEAVEHDCSHIVFVCVYPQKTTRQRKDSVDIAIRCFTVVISTIPPLSADSRRHRGIPGLIDKYFNI